MCSCHNRQLYASKPKTEISGHNLNPNLIIKIFNTYNNTTISVSTCKCRKNIKYQKHVL